MSDVIQLWQGTPKPGSNQPPPLLTGNVCLSVQLLQALLQAVQTGAITPNQYGQVALKVSIYQNGRMTSAQSPQYTGKVYHKMFDFRQQQQQGYAAPMQPGYPYPQPQPYQPAPTGYPPPPQPYPPVQQNGYIPPPPQTYQTTPNNFRIG